MILPNPIEQPRADLNLGLGLLVHLQASTLPLMLLVHLRITRSISWLIGTGSNISRNPDQGPYGNRVPLSPSVTPLTSQQKTAVEK